MSGRDGGLGGSLFAYQTGMSELGMRWRRQGPWAGGFAIPYLIKQGRQTLQTGWGELNLDGYARTICKYPAR